MSRTASVAITGTNLVTDAATMRLPLEWSIPTVVLDEMVFRFDASVRDGQKVRNLTNAYGYMHHLTFAE